MPFRVTNGMENESGPGASPSMRNLPFASVVAITVEPLVMPTPDSGASVLASTMRPTTLPVVGVPPGSPPPGAGLPTAQAAQVLVKAGTAHADAPAAPTRLARLSI